MRTTVIIPDPVFSRIKANIRKSGESLSQFVANALEMYMLKKDQQSESNIKTHNIHTYSMGEPTIDITSRDEIYQKLEQD